MKTFFALSIIILILIPIIHAETNKKDNTIYQPAEFTRGISIRKLIADAVIISDSNPFFGLLGTSVACWYDKAANTTGLIPLFIQQKGNLTDAQKRFLDTYFTSIDHTPCVIG